MYINYWAPFCKLFAFSSFFFPAIIIKNPSIPTEYNPTQGCNDSLIIMSNNTNSILGSSNNSISMSAPLLPCHSTTTLKPMQGNATQLNSTQANPTMQPNTTIQVNETMQPNTTIETNQTTQANLTSEALTPKFTTPMMEGNITQVNTTQNSSSPTPPPAAEIPAKVADQINSTQPIPKDQELPETVMNSTDIASSNTNPMSKPINFTTVQPVETGKTEGVEIMGEGKTVPLSNITSKSSDTNGGNQENHYQDP